MNPLAAWLTARLAAAPDAPLLSDGVARLDVRQVAQRSAALAAVLNTDGGPPRVASRLDNGIDWALLDLAVRQLDGVHIPLPGFFSAEQAAHALRDSTPDWLLLPRGVPAPGAEWQAEVAAPGLLQAQLWRRREGARAPLPAGTACITYTSGTTAQPKGVCLSAAALWQVAESLAAAAAGLQVQRHLCVLPLATLLENIGGLYAAALAGAEICLPGLTELGYSGAAGLQPARLLAAINAHAAHSLILVPQLLAGLLQALAAGGSLHEPLRFVAVGGARVAPTLLQQAEALGLPVYEGYGLSECASVVCLNRPGARRPGTVGRPLPHVRLRIDAAGEVHVAGAGHLGYLGGPPRAGEEIATGDLGRLDADGYLTLLGRRRNVFITAYGRNVSPEWLESELTADPRIAQAVVDGEARPWNVAVLVTGDSQADRGALLRAVRAINQRFPDYARVGAVVWAEAPFRADNGLATANGRPRREAVLARYADAIAALYQQPAAPLADDAPAFPHLADEDAACVSTSN